MVYTLSVALAAVIAPLAISCNRKAQPDRLGGLPSDAQLVFTSNRDTDCRRKEVYAMDRDGGRVTRITNTSEHHRLPTVSPCRRYLLVTRSDDDTHPPPGPGDEDRRNLWLLDFATGTETRLTPRSNMAEGNSFSPDGEWIVFWMVREGEDRADIYRIRRDRTGLTRLTDSPNATAADPSWSNDGTRIAYISFSPDTPRFVLKEMDADGGNARTIYDPDSSVATPHFPPGVYDPSYSPDDEWLVFSKPVGYNRENGDAGIWHIFKIRTDGSELVNLSAQGGHTDMAEYLPSFSPDRRTIVFTARHGPSDPARVRIDIYAMDITGRDHRRLTSHPAYDEFGAWIPEDRPSSPGPRIRQR